MGGQAVPQQEAPVPSEPDLRQSMLRFVSEAAHEIVGPLNQVASLVALLVNRYRGQLDDDAQDLLTHIESAAARASGTANSLRTYFRILTSEAQNAPAKTTQALDSAVDALQEDIEKSGAQISNDSLPDVHADTHLLTLLFHAIIHNSLKFRRIDTPPRIVVSAEVQPYDTSALVRFSVTDNGIGIDPAFHQAVFNPFTRLNGHAYPGEGMGLTIARAIAEILKGRIWVGGSMSEGTTVFFELPAA